MSRCWKWPKKTVENASIVRFEKADAVDLPFQEDSFDALVCQFGIMFVPEKRRAYSEAARVLRASGRFHFNVWDTLDTNLFAKSIHQEMEKLYPDDPPKFLELPFGYNDINLIVRDLQSAGFSNVEISVAPLTSTADTPRDIALGFGAGGPLANEVSSRATLSLEEVLERLERALEDQFGIGPCHAPMQAIQFIASKTDNGVINTPAPHPPH